MLAVWSGMGSMSRHAVALLSFPEMFDAYRSRPQHGGRSWGVPPSDRMSHFASSKWKYEAIHILKMMAAAPPFHYRVYP